MCGISKNLKNLFISKKNVCFILILLLRGSSIRTVECKVEILKFLTILLVNHNTYSANFEVNSPHDHRVK